MPHTPGPWVAVDHSHDQGRWRIYSDVWLIARTVSDAHEDNQPDPEECNARLIAAAPDLLDALKTARNVLTVACGTEAPFIRIALSKIDAAIAKAEVQPPGIQRPAPGQTDAANTKKEGD